MLRHHQRRCTGRKVDPSSLIIRGSVKLACAISYAGRNAIAYGGRLRHRNFASFFYRI
ncbi:hypothetical protein WDZ92_37420 [Nostoc sp. NIES-2111]